MLDQFMSAKILFLARSPQIMAKTGNKLGRRSGRARHVSTKNFPNNVLSTLRCSASKTPLGSTDLSSVQWIALRSSLEHSESLAFSSSNFSTSWFILNTSYCPFCHEGNKFYLSASFGVAPLAD